MTRIPYGRWFIERNPKPIPTRSHDWDYWHDDYDGAPDAGDDRCGSAASMEACMAAIDEHEAEHGRSYRCRVCGKPAEHNNDACVDCYTTFARWTEFGQMPRNWRWQILDAADRCQRSAW